MTKLSMLEDRLLQLEFLTLPEQINPNKMLVIGDSKDSIIGKVEQTQLTLANLGKEHKQLEVFIAKYQDVQDCLIPSQMHHALADIEVMKEVVSCSLLELEFLAKQLASVKELKYLVDEKFENVKSQQNELDILFRNSPKEMITNNHSEYLEILQDYFLYIQKLSSFFLSLQNSN